VADLSEEGFRGGSGLGEKFGSGCRVVVLDFAGCEVILRSADALKASFVENIRVSRFVIDGLSAIMGAALRCGSEGGAACPLRFSTLGTALPFCPVAGRDSGDPITDDAVEAVGEVWGFSAMGVSLCAVTVAMVGMCEVLVKGSGGID
jgi:hypothetical protein